MTREEKRQRRQRNLIMAICIGILAVWFAALLCSTVNAAHITETVEQELNPLTEALAVIGTGWVAWALMRGIEWLDKPKKERHARANERTACEIRF